ncbi:hypothetical protein [Parasegetibacter sp. NRK P23]|uniref:hypothetical protein n=1 Tax=Parasegetibacter sp. NRK P23 TaxID=2942999 RepID=UPI002044625C|nr:hypothetical protein [Parasegetibacter sp. NRK P23]MCM5530632.1 hypothetical protein [Parasegetibacter sp. NRK P23]
MKRIILGLMLIMSTCYLNAQTNIRDGRHIFNYDVSLTQCNFDGSAIAGATAERIEANTIFYVKNIVGSDYIIQIAKFTSNTASAKALNTKLVSTATGSDIFFKLPQRSSEDSYELNAERLEKKGLFTVGAATTLIKIRPGREEPKDGYNIYSEFGNDFNIGISAGWKFKPYRRTQLSHSLVGGLSFSSIKVTPYTTQDFIQSEATQGCVTFSAGYVFEYNKFQVSVFSGIDVMSGEIGRKWIYRNRPWLGLGFGFQIFRGQGETSN